MPFTFAHPAIVLPLNKLGARWISLTALVIGAMTPDFEYFLRLDVAARYGHDFWGIFYFDLPLGFFLLIIYQSWVKQSLTAHLPKYLNSRLGAYSKLPEYSFRYAAVISISLIIGAASHLFWDSFTHPHRYFVDLFNLDRTFNIGPLQKPIYKLFQHGSTLVGFATIIMVINSLPTGGYERSKRLLFYWACVAIVTVIVLGLKILLTQSQPAYGALIVTAISGFLLGILVASLTAGKRFKTITGA